MPRQFKTKRKRPLTADRVGQALRYYRSEQWDVPRLREKGGRLAIRLLALNQSLEEKTGGAGLLPKSMKRSLEQLVQLHRPKSELL